MRSAHASDHAPSTRLLVGHVAGALDQDNGDPALGDGISAADLLPSLKPAANHTVFVDSEISESIGREKV